MALYLGSYQHLSFDFKDEKCAGVLVPCTHPQFEEVKSLSPGDVVVFKNEIPLPDSLEVHVPSPSPAVSNGQTLVVFDVLHLKDVGVYLHAHNPI